VSDEAPPAAGGAGSYLAGYRLDEEIGRGGMAVVYRAYDGRLQRRVALKILAPELAADDAFRRRFIRESRAAAAVDHPHIIPIFEAGQASGVLFIAMRMAQQGDVRTLIDRNGPLPLARVCAIITQVASALDATHAAGLVHRDVKPANMLLDSTPGMGQPDHVYLSDFGLSKPALSGGDGPAGQFLGTPKYVSPEQIGGRPVDGRTDLYALACSVFVMLTGSPPFGTEETAAIMWAKLSTPPPPVTSLRGDLPPALDDVMAKALATTPSQRYATCGLFAQALRRASGLESGTQPVPVLPGGRRESTDVILVRDGTPTPLPAGDDDGAGATDQSGDLFAGLPAGLAEFLPQAEPGGSLPGLPSGGFPGSGRPAGNRPAGALSAGDLADGDLADDDLADDDLADGVPDGFPGRPPSVSPGRFADSRPSGSRPSGSLPSGSGPSRSRPSGGRHSSSQPSGGRHSGSRPSRSRPSRSGPSGGLAGEGRFADGPPLAPFTGGPGAGPPPARRGTQALLPRRRRKSRRSRATTLLASVVGLGLGLSGASFLLGQTGHPLPFGLPGHFLQAGQTGQMPQPSQSGQPALGAAALKPPGCTTRTAAAQQLTQVPSQTVTVGGHPFDVAAGRDGFSFASVGSGVAVLSTASPIPVLLHTTALAGALGEALTPNQHYLLVAAGNGAAVYRVTELEQGDVAPLGRLASPGDQHAVEAAVTPDGRFAFVTFQNSAHVGVFDLDRALRSGFTGALIGRIPVGPGPGGIALSPDGRYAYVASNLAAPNTAAGVVNVIDVRKAEQRPGSALVAAVPAGCRPSRVAVSASGSQVWVTANGSNAVLGFAASRLISDPRHALVARVTVGQAPLGLIITADGRRVVVADTNRNPQPGSMSGLAVVGTQQALAGQRAVLGYLPAGATPRQFALEPDGHTLLVTDADSARLQTFNLADLP
jgi:serine/threonine protein kinase/DNA-binding beta-propeller fold protein YncE